MDGQRRDSLSDELFALNVDVQVILDTGSSDLWVLSPNEPVQTLNDSHLLGNISYGTGSVSGPIQFAELQLGEYSVPSQGEHVTRLGASICKLTSIGLAFINVNQVCEKCLLKDVIDSVDFRLVPTRRGLGCHQISSASSVFPSTTT